LICGDVDESKRNQLRRDFRGPDLHGLARRENCRSRRGDSTFAANLSRAERRFSARRIRAWGFVLLTSAGVHAEQPCGRGLASLFVGFGSGWLCGICGFSCSRRTSRRAVPIEPLTFLPASQPASHAIVFRNAGPSQSGQLARRIVRIWTGRHGATGRKTPLLRIPYQCQRQVRNFGLLPWKIIQH
jgi:hypothetical protein